MSDETFEEVKRRTIMATNTDFVRSLAGESVSDLLDRPAQKLGLVEKGVNCSSCVQQDLSWVCR